MSWLKLNGENPVEFRILPPDDTTDWQQVESDDPRIAQIGSIQPQWGAFRLSVLNKQEQSGQQFHAALALFMATDAISTGALMNEASKDAPYVQYLREAWNGLANAAEYIPPDGAVEAWNAIAQATNVPLEWLPNGRLAI